MSQRRATNHAEKDSASPSARWSPDRFFQPVVNLPQPVTLEGHGVRLEPLTEEHSDALAAAAGDGRLLPWIVRDLPSGGIVGSTRYHDIVPAIDRVEIGHTWYGRSRQRTHVNTTCKLLLLGHAFDTLGCKVVGLRTDNFNFRSQRAIEALGAQKDGVIRHYGIRRDGSARDVVMYSILATEWPDVRRHLELRLQRHK